MSRYRLEEPTAGYVWVPVEATLSAAGGVEFRCRKSKEGLVRLDTVRWRKLD